jgi:hypothetical protein
MDADVCEALTLTRKCVTHWHFYAHKHTGTCTDTDTHTHINTYIHTHTEAQKVPFFNGKKEVFSVNKRASTAPKGIKSGSKSHGWLPQH